MMAETLEKFEEMILRGIPLNRIGKPSDMAASLLYLCSPGASYVTGALLPVDGGALVKSNL